MPGRRKVPRPPKPTGQELDRQSDELHEEPDADELPTPEEQRQEKEQALEDYSEDWKHPDQASSDPRASVAWCGGWRP